MSGSTAIPGGKMKVYCNQDLTNRSDADFEFIRLEQNGDPLRSKVRAALAKARDLANSGVDAVLIFHPQVSDLMACFWLKRIRPEVKILYFDILLKRPMGVKGKAFANVKKWLLKSCDVVLCVHKDTTAYCHYYGIEKTRYVPFKANNFQRRDAVDVSDQGYILSCGVSHRDYETFFKAVNGLSTPVKVAFPDDKNVLFHQASLGSGIPDNVEIIRHDFNPESWNRLIAGATFVVIPITPDCIQPAGISVYLESMALGKAVVISEGPSTAGLIDEGQARIVRRGDAASMKAAIEELLENPKERQRYEENGYEYAMKLAGVDRLIVDLKKALSETLVN